MQLTVTRCNCSAAQCKACTVQQCCAPTKQGTLLVQASMSEQAKCCDQIQLCVGGMHPPI